MDFEFRKAYTGFIVKFSYFMFYPMLMVAWVANDTAFFEARRIRFAITKRDHGDPVIRDGADLLGEGRIDVGQDGGLLECRAGENNDIGVPAFAPLPFNQPTRSFSGNPADADTQERRAPNLREQTLDQSSEPLA